MADSSLCSCPYRNCGSTDVARTETFSKAIEYFCHACKRYFSKQVEAWPKRWSDPTYLGDGPWGA